jgi:hypothetical protein
MLSEEGDCLINRILYTKFSTYPRKPALEQFFRSQAPSALSSSCIYPVLTHKDRVVLYFIPKNSRNCFVRDITPAF